MSRYTRHANTFQKADARKLCVRSVLSWPYPDLAGDVVELDGLDFTPHERTCEIDLEHGRTHLKDFPVAWARESLSQPGAPYAVERVYMNLAGDGEPDEYHNVPIGTSYFDPSDRISSQTFALVEQGALPAVSLEFRMVPGCFKALRPSPLEPRYAYQFSKALVDRWTVCAVPVNGGAMHLEDDTVHKSVAVPPTLAKILLDRRVSVGGVFETLHERLYKALAPHAQPRTTTVRVEQKAMEPDDDEMNYGDDGFPAESGTDADLTPEMDADVEGDMGAPAKPTVQAHYDAAQSLLDIVDKAEMDLQSSEHVKGKAFMQKKLEAIKKLAEELKGMGDKIDTELSGKMDDAEAEPDGDEDGEEPSDDDGDAPGDDEADDEGDDDKPFKKADITRDASGVLAKVRPVYKAALLSIQKAVPRRLKSSEVKKAKDGAERKVRSVFDQFKAAIQ